MKELKSFFQGKGLAIVDSKLEDYLNFCVSNRYDGAEYSEKHHILPQAHFREFAKEDWNIVTLLYADHVTAHALLAEALPQDKSAAFAHFMMKAQTGALTNELREMNVKMLTGEGNPSKKAEVRAKISVAKTGKARPDMVGKQYMGASDETIQRAKKSMGLAHRGMIPVRLPDGSVIKVSRADPRYVSGELKSIIGHKKGQPGPISDPAAKAKFLQSLEERKQKFAAMTGDQIADYCLEQQGQGKKLVTKGKVASNYTKLFGFAGLTPADFLEVVEDKVQRLSKAQQTTQRLFWSE